MDDWKLKECWVVVTDVMRGIGAHSPLQGRVTLEESATPLKGADFLNSAVPMVTQHNCDASREGAVGSSRLPYEKTSCQVGVKANNRNKLKNGKRLHALWKSLHKKNNTVSTAATKLKHHLRLKYGKTLLRKPSFHFQEINKTSVTSLVRPDQKGVNSSNQIKHGANGDRPIYNPRPKLPQQGEENVHANISLNEMSTTNAIKEINKNISFNNQHIDAHKLPPFKGISVHPTDSALLKHLVIHTTSNGSYKNISGCGGVFTNPLCPMPSVGLTVDVRVGCPLPLLQAKCVLTCLKECKNSLTPEYAEFCSAVVQTSSQPSTKRMILPMKDEQVLQFMQIKWKARSAVKKVALASHLEASNVNNFMLRAHDNTTTLSINTAENKDNMQENVAKHGARTTRREDSVHICNKSPNVLVEKHDQNYPNPDQEYCKKNQCDQYPKLHPYCVKQTNLSPKDKTVCKSRSNLHVNASNTDLLRSEVLSTFNNCVLRKHSKLSLLSGDKEKLVTPDIITIEDDGGTGKKAAGNTASLMSRRNLKNINGTASACTIDYEDEMFNVPKKTALDIPQAEYDPDDTRGVEDFEIVAEQPRGMIRGRSSHLMHELRRLNVAVFDVTDSLDPTECKLPEICRLGCVCHSLTARVVRDNCGLVSCLFGCVCLKNQSTRRENHTFTWIQNKAKANLAKEERHFKQTVVRSGKDDLILVDGKRKREIKLPKKYSEDFLSDTHFQLFRHAGSKKLPKTAPSDTVISDKVENLMKTSKREKGLLDTSVRGKSESLRPNQIIPTAAASSCGMAAPLKETNVVQNSCELNGSNTEPSVEENSAKKDISGPPSPVIESNISARTACYGYSSKEDRKAKQKELLNETSCVKIEPVNELKIVSTKSLRLQDWEKKNTIIFPNKGMVTSCSVLFYPEFIKEKENEVVLLQWTVLRKAVVEKKVFLWCKTMKSKPKIYLTNSYIKPSPNSVELHVLSRELNDLPFHLRTLMSDYSPVDEDAKFVWIAKHVKSQWMIVGFMQPDHQNNQLRCNSEVDILPSQDEDSSKRWWVMDLRQNFDLIYFMDFQKALSKHQLDTLISLSIEDSGGGQKVHRILLNRSRPKIDPTPVPFPDFGAYSLSERPNEVLIGPYHSFKEPRFQVYSLKVAHNGKSEFEAVPLFYCGGGECVRVNSQGVLSLHSEKLPSRYVQGSWYQSRGDNLRDSDKKLLAVEKLVEQDGAPPNPSHGTAADSSPVSSQELDEIMHTENPEVHSDADFVLTLPAKSFITPSKDKENVIVSKRKELSDNEINVSVPSPKLQIKTRSDNQESFHTQGGGAHKRPKSAPVSLLKKIKIVQTSDPAMEVDQDCGLQLNSSKSDSNSGHENESLLDYEESGEVGMEYLIPSVREIGYLPLTHLPGGTISVIHFTSPGLLKFYHTKQELIRDINMLIHQKLACLSRKCSILLKSEVHCKCVSWKSSHRKEEFAHLHQFSPEVFNGFFMLTDYGLLDLRSADESTVTKLGQDWVEWLKNDEIRLKLSEWKSGEEREVTEKHQQLMNVLTSNQRSNLTLLQATDEIAKLKAEDQLLDYENQTQELMKETLILSLCRKLNGIPGHLVPKLLQQLELDLLWEVLECMDSRNTALLPEERLVHSSPVLSTSCSKDNLEKTPPSCRKGGPKEHSPKSRERSRAAEMASIDLKEEVSPRSRAIRYRQRLLDQCILEGRQQMSKKLQQECEKGTAHAETTRPLVDSADGLHLKEGLVCRMAPFARLNICVEEGGIKYTPLPSPPLTSPLVQESASELPVSPGKPPNILRKSKTQPVDNPLPGTSASSSLVYSVQKQSRKQTFSCDNNEEPVFTAESVLDPPKRALFVDSVLSSNESPCTKEDVSNSFCTSRPFAVSKATVHQSRLPVLAPQTSDVDPISSLRITSVISEAENDPTALQGETDLSTAATNMDSVDESPSPGLTSVPGIKAVPPSYSCAQSVTATSADENLNDPISSLRITSVFSAKNMSSEFPATQYVSSAPSSSPNIVPASSLRVSSVKSGVMVSTPPSLSPEKKTLSNAMSRIVVPLDSANSPQARSTSAMTSFPSSGASSGLITKLILKPTIIKPASSLKKADDVFDCGQAGIASSRMIVPSQMSAVRTFSLTPGLATKPSYMISTQGGKLVRTHTQTMMSLPIQGCADPKPKGITVLQKNGPRYTLTIPVSSLKMMPTTAPNKGCDTKLITTTASIASSTTTVLGRPVFKTCKPGMTSPASVVPNKQDL